MLQETHCFTSNNSWSLTWHHKQEQSTHTFSTRYKMPRFTGCIQHFCWCSLYDACQYNLLGSDSETTHTDWAALPLSALDKFFANYCFNSNFACGQYCKTPSCSLCVSCSSLELVPTQCEKFRIVQVINASATSDQLRLWSAVIFTSLRLDSRVEIS